MFNEELPFISATFKMQLFIVKYELINQLKG